jgi:hypothetical protein
LANWISLEIVTMFLSSKVHALPTYGSPPTLSSVGHQRMPTLVTSSGHHRLERSQKQPMLVRAVWLQIWVNCPTSAKEIQTYPHRCRKVTQDSSYACILQRAHINWCGSPVNKPLTSGPSKTEFHYIQWPSLGKNELKFAPRWHKPSHPLSPAPVSVGMLLVMYEVDRSPPQLCWLLRVE